MESMGYHALYGIVMSSWLAPWGWWNHSHNMRRRVEKAVNPLSGFLLHPCSRAKAFKGSDVCWKFFLSSRLSFHGRQGAALALVIPVDRPFFMTGRFWRVRCLLWEWQPRPLSDYNSQLLSVIPPTPTPSVAATLRDADTTTSKKNIIAPEVL